MDLLTFHLCSIQARLFELSVKKGYDSKVFITEYMKQDILILAMMIYNGGEKNTFLII